MEELVSDVTLARLNEIFKSIMKKQVDKIDPIRSKFGKIEKEEVSLSEKMAYLENYCLTHSRSVSAVSLRHRRARWRSLSRFSPFWN